MPSPFPGVDPYLEAPYLWEDVHSSLANDIRAQLQPQLQPQYIAALTPYVTYEDIAIAETSTIKPDVAVLERAPQHAGDTATLTMEAPFSTATALEPMTIPIRSQRIEVRAVGTNTLVTVIEILSPINKRIASEGHAAYSKKRLDLLESDVHLLELDLLRRGIRWPTRDALPDAPYFVFLSRANRRPRVEVWPLTFREPPVPMPVPLRPPDRDVTFDLAAALSRVYEIGAFALRVDYQDAPPMPELGSGDSRWLDERLRAAGLR